MLLLQFLPRDATLSERGYTACHLYVTFRYRDHILIGWNTSKIISRLFTLTPTWASGAAGTPQN